MKVECRTNPNHQCDVQFRQILRHKPLLFRRTEADPYDVWFELTDLRGKFCFLFSIQASKRRAKRADDADSWEALLETRLQFLRDAGSAAIEEVRELAAPRCIEYIEHEIGAVNAVHMSADFVTSEPHEWHAVGGV